MRYKFLRTASLRKTSRREVRGPSSRRNQFQLVVGTIILIAFAAAVPQCSQAQTVPPRSVPDPYHELETKYLFGFTEGADLDSQGELALEWETTGSFQKRGGGYTGLEQEFELEGTPSQYWEYELSAHFTRYDISSVEGLKDTHSLAFSGLSSEFRYAAIIRGPGSPFGLTLTAAPEWARIDDAAQPITDLSTTFKVVADTELIPNRLYAAANLIYIPDVARSPGESWQTTSTFGATAAISYRIAPKITPGAEVEYYRAFDGILFQSTQGQALYVGPTIHIQASNKVMIAAAFSAQVAGHATGDIRPLDLTNFPRYRFNLKAEFEF